MVYKNNGRKMKIYINICSRPLAKCQNRLIKFNATIGNAKWSTQEVHSKSYSH